MIFADKVILYEGDSERLYIRKLIKLPEFLPLNDSYIAFIQVGGAYAHNYLPILRMLLSLIFSAYISQYKSSTSL